MGTISLNTAEIINLRNSIKIMGIYQLSNTGGVIDKSYLLFNQLNNENLVLDKSKYYLLFIATGCSGYSASFMQSISYSLYSRFRLPENRKVELSEALDQDLIKSKQIDSFRQERHSSKKNDFFFRSKKLTGYGELVSKSHYFVLTPEGSDPEKDLEVYGGLNMDVRELIFMGCENKLLRILADSRSFVLSSPVYIRHAVLPAALGYIGGNLTDCTSRPFNFSTDPKVKNKRDLSPGYNLYGYLNRNWGMVTGNLFDPINIVYHYLHRLNRYYGNSLIQIGERSLPEITKLRSFKEEQLDEMRLEISLEPSLLFEEIKVNPVNEIDAAFYDAALRNALNMSVVLNSTKTLCRDLYSVVHHTLYDKCRWKGSRKAGEVKFAGALYATLCILKSPKVFVDSFWKTMFTGHNPTDLYTYRCILSMLYENELTFGSSIEPAFKNSKSCSKVDIQSADVQMVLGSNPCDTYLGFYGLTQDRFYLRCLANKYVISLEALASSDKIEYILDHRLQRDEDEGVLFNSTKSLKWTHKSKELGTKDTQTNFEDLKKTLGLLGWKSEDSISYRERIVKAVTKLQEIEGAILSIEDSLILFNIKTYLQEEYWT